MQQLSLNFPIFDKAEVYTDPHNPRQISIYSLSIKQKYQFGEEYISLAYSLLFSCEDEGVSPMAI
jgi:hypothetical protein